MLAGLPGHVRSGPACCPGARPGVGALGWSPGADLMASYPAIEESLDRLRRAGWLVGDHGTRTSWVVTGSKGENVLYAEGRTQAEAWWRACERAGAAGLPAGAWEG